MENFKHVVGCQSADFRYYFRIAYRLGTGVMVSSLQLGAAGHGIPVTIRKKYPPPPVPAPPGSSCLDRSCNVRKSDNLQLGMLTLFKDISWMKGIIQCTKVLFTVVRCFPFGFRWSERRTPFFFVFQIFSRSKLATFPPGDQ